MRWPVRAWNLQHAVGHETENTVGATVGATLSLGFGRKDRGGNLFDQRAPDDEDIWFVIKAPVVECRALAWGRGREAEFDGCGLGSTSGFIKLLDGQLNT